MNVEKFDFFISKLLFNLIALIGVLFIFMTGVYFGYTFHENEQYFDTNIKEIKFVKYVNDKYTYDFQIEDNKYITLTTQDALKRKEIMYGEELGNRIATACIVLVILGILLLEIGYKGSAKYKYKKSLKERIKGFVQRLKND